MTNPQETPAPTSSRRTTGQKKTGWKSFLTPGWALALILVVAFSYFAFTTLAPWQLGKNERNSATNQRLQEAFQHDPVAINTVIEPGEYSVPTDDEWTHVSMQGSYLPGEDVILRNRAVDGAVVFQILTPFKTASDQGHISVMVNRGYIAPGNGGTIPEIPAAPQGTTTVTGYLRLDEDPGQGTVAKADGQDVVNSISATLNEQATGEQLLDGYVQADDNSADDGLTATPLPQLESGPYLSYGIQWIAFGIIAPIGLGWFVWNEIKERRREKEELAELEASSATSGSPNESIEKTTSTTSTTDAESSARAGEKEDVASDNRNNDAQRAHDAAVEKKMADRYGSSRAKKSKRDRKNQGERF